MKRLIYILIILLASLFLGNGDNGNGSAGGFKRFKTFKTFKHMGNKE